MEPQGRQDEDEQNNVARYPPDIDATPAQAVQPTYSVIEGPRAPVKAQEFKGSVSIECCPEDARDDTNESEDDDDSSSSSESPTTPLIKCRNN